MGSSAISAYSTVNPFFKQDRDIGCWGKSYAELHGASKLRGAVITDHALKRFSLYLGAEDISYKCLGQ